MFQQDGAPLHWAIDVGQCLDTNFRGVGWGGGPIPSLARSSGLLLQISLCTALKNIMSFLFSYNLVLIGEK